MSTATLEAHHKLSSQLSADAVDTAHGIIRGATVAKSGVQATGKFYVTPDGKEYPVFTDGTTLTTLMAAAAAVGKRVKVRKDHIDEISARAGYADEFKLTDDGRVTADIHLFKSFTDRELVLETSIETPEEMGLSIDFTPTFEVRDGKALMRVSELHGVDIVNEGAITHGGLFLSASVDTTPKVEPQKISPTATMAATSPTIDELNASIAKTNEGYAALSKQVADITAALSKLTPPTPPAATPDPAAMAAINEQKAQLAALNEKFVQLKREKALLGFRGTSEERAKLATAAPEEIEKVAAEKKDYMQLVADRVASEKCDRMSAHHFVRQNHKAEYRAYRETEARSRMVA